MSFADLDDSLGRNLDRDPVFLRNVLRDFVHRVSREARVLLVPPEILDPLRRGGAVVNR